MKTAELRKLLSQRASEPLAAGCYSRLEITCPQPVENTDRSLLAKQHRIYAETWSRKNQGGEKSPRII